MSATTGSPPTPEGRSRGHWLERFGTPALLLMGVTLHGIAIATFLFLTVQRIGYPLELGWVEGVLMDSIHRLAQLQPVYPAPTLDYVPLAYMPGYYMLAAPLVQIFGHQLWVPRALSLLQTLLIAALLARVVYRETGQRAMAIAAPALFLGAFAFCGSSYDHVQPNSQLVLFALAGVLALRESRGAGGALAAGAWFGMSFLTKQHGLLIGLAMLPYLALHERRRFLPFLLSLAVCAGGGYLLFSAIFGSWFVFYTYDVPSHWSAFDLLKIENLGRYAFGVFGLSTTLTILGVLAAGTDPSADRRASIWWWCAAGGFAAAFLATFDPYSYRHTLVPMVAALALVAPIAAWRVVRVTAAGRASPALAAALVLLLLVPQYAPLLYSVRRHIPPRDGAALRARFYERLQSIPGSVLLLNHGFYLQDAGARPSLHLLALEDILRSDGNSLLRRDPGYIDRQFAGLMSGPGRPWIVADLPLEEMGDHSNPWWRRIATRYAVRDSFTMFYDSGRFITGPDTTPRYLYAPVASAEE